MQAVLAEINGWYTEPAGPAHHGAQVASFTDLAADGSTACGCWIYSGVYGPDGVNRALRREPSGPYGHGWGFAWPADRRILYNRASARPDGRAWRERKQRVVGRGRGTLDGLDGPTSRSPSARIRAAPGDTGMAPSGRRARNHARRTASEDYVPGAQGRDASAHYDHSIPGGQTRFTRRQTNPPARWFARHDKPLALRAIHASAVRHLPDYRDHTAGGMSRTLSHLSGSSTAFAEVSPSWPASSDSSTAMDHCRASAATVRGGASAPVGAAVRWRSGLHQVAIRFTGGDGRKHGDVVTTYPDSASQLTIHEGSAVGRVVAGRRARRVRRSARARVGGRPSPYASEAGKPAHDAGQRRGRRRPRTGRRRGRSKPGGHGQEGRNSAIGPIPRVIPAARLRRDGVRSGSSRPYRVHGCKACEVACKSGSVPAERALDRNVYDIPPLRRLDLGHVKFSSRRAGWIPGGGNP